MSKKYKQITDYEERFELNSKNKKKQTAALKKAWENRDFEIDKFWTRSAYFWGFIAVIFGAYIGVTTTKYTSKVEDLHLDLYLILLGIIFSVAWLKVIEGSKRWQENWEAHIDKLENDITGPLYKTIYCTGEPFFSVSKINTILAWVVVITWFVLLMQYFAKNIELFNEIFNIVFAIIQKGYFFVLLPVAGTIICVIVLMTKGQSDGGKYRVNTQGERGVFVDRSSS